MPPVIAFVLLGLLFSLLTFGWLSLYACVDQGPGPWFNAAPVPCMVSASAYALATERD